MFADDPDEPGIPKRSASRWDNLAPHTSMLTSGSENRNEEFPAENKTKKLFD